MSQEFPVNASVGSSDLPGGIMPASGEKIRSEQKHTMSSCIPSIPSILINPPEFTWSGLFSGIVSPGCKGTISHVPSASRSVIRYREQIDPDLPEGILDLMYPDSTFLGHLEALHYLNFTDR